MPMKNTAASSRHAPLDGPRRQRGQGPEQADEETPGLWLRAFDIVNVAGDGDEEERSEDALQKVRQAISGAGNDGYTITLSCGKLTTGVTVPEVDRRVYAGRIVLHLRRPAICKPSSACSRRATRTEKSNAAATCSTSPPDRTLKMVAESAALSTKAGKANESDRRIMGEFLNYCPVIAVDGTMMKAYDTNRLLQQLKRAYAERAVQNGFDDATSITTNCCGWKRWTSSGLTS